MHQDKPQTAGKAGSDPTRVVMIKVNGVEFTVQNYASFLQANPTIVSKAVNSDAGKADALREMASAELLKEALYKEGLLSKSAGEPTRKDTVQAYEKLAAKYFPVPAAPDEKAAYQYYVDHQNLFGIPEMVRLNQILFSLPRGTTTAVETAARQKAEAALKRLDAGESFADVAADLTENKIGKVARGDIGFQQRDLEPWLGEALKDRKVGERTAIVKSPEGFEILQITDQRPAIVSPYANVRDRVVASLREAEQDKLRSAYVRELAKTAKLEVIQADLKPLFPNGIIPQ